MSDSKSEKQNKEFWGMVMMLAGGVAVIVGFIFFVDTFYKGYLRGSDVPPVLVAKLTLEAIWSFYLTYIGRWMFSYGHKLFW